jgi:hypothetical protein
LSFFSGDRAGGGVGAMVAHRVRIPGAPARPPKGLIREKTTFIILGAEANAPAAMRRAADFLFPLLVF